MKALWTGMIAFGRVHIPVKLYSATQASELDLDLLDKKDKSNIRLQRINEKTGQEVAWENIVKGYRLDGQYITLSDKDFEQAMPQKSKMITISSFVDLSEIDSIYYENAYYIEPEETGAKAYALLREALLQSGKAGVASFVFRNREVLAVLRVYEDIIILNRIRFQQEIRVAEGLHLPSKKEVKDEELEIALKLIDQLSSPFQISQYKDTYAEALMKMILAKTKGEEVKAPQMRVVHSKATDLMGQLKASLSKRKKAS
jgi:DNA end-binding protein Ku